MQEFNFKQKLLWEEGYMSGSKNIETQTGLVHAMRSNGPLHQVYLQWTTNKILIKKHGSPAITTASGGVLTAFTTGIVVLPLLPPPLWWGWWWGWWGLHLWW